MSEKTKVILLYGGQSTEHEISCRSAAFVTKFLDQKAYELHAIGIDRQGRFLPQPTARYQDETPNVLDIIEGHTGPSQEMIRCLQPGHGLTDQDKPVVFSLLHGTNGEDGAMQGLLELCQLPYTGPDVAASALTMDKILTKELAQNAGIPVVPYVWLRKGEWLEDHEAWLQRIRGVLSGPWFVKPASLGSSVGIGRASNLEELEAAIQQAFDFDEKVLVETALKIREIEYAALGDYEPEVSLPGEIKSDGFYSYDSKYSDESTAKVEIADLSKDAQEEGKDLCRRIYKALNLYGMARIDLFLTDDGRFYLNEVNTVPGFTSISQYPLLWKASGIDYPELLNRLIQLALKRSSSKSQLKRQV